MRVPFHQIFQISNGAIMPRTQVLINGVTMSPGVMFGAGVMFGGVDLSQLVNRDLEVEFTNGVTVIKGHY
jgi:hypothetical protein